MAHIHGVFDSDVHFSIDHISRAIKNETTNAKTKIVQYDHNSERFTFELPRHIEGHDMLTCNVVQVHYINIGSGNNKSNGLYEVDDLQVSPENEDVVICSWLISQNATKFVGTLNFILRFICTTDGVLDYVWNTAIYNAIVVAEGINNSDIVVEEYADILEQWRQELTVSDEKIQAAVNAYLEENPPSGGIDKKTITAYEAGAVRPFLRYDTFWDVVNPIFVTQHMNERATNNSVEIINDGATVHEVDCVLSPNGKYVYITYLKNIDGTTADVGSTSESGTSKIYFTAAYNAYGVTQFTPAMSEATVELFAKGQELADGTTIDTGGPSMPMLYSDGTTLFAVCCFAGNGCGGYVRTADISGNPAPEDVVWSAAQPWTLSIDGESGNFDMNRLNGWTDATWQTNNQIVWESSISQFVTAVCVNDKAVVLLKSTDGINWNYTNTIYTDYLCKFQCEAAVFRQSTSNIWIAVRNGNTGTSTSKLACGNQNYLTVFKVSATGAKIEEYNIPDTGVKPWFIPVPSSTKKGAYLLHNAQSRYSIQVEYIGDYYPGMTLGEMYGIGTNYCCGVVRSTSATDTSIMLMGTTGLVTEKTGASLVYNIRLGQFLDSATSLETIQNIVTRAIDTEVTKDSTNLITSGAVKTALNAVSGGGGAVWVNVANETLEAEASGFTEITLEEPRTISRMRVYVETVGTATNEADTYMQVVINGKNMACSLGSAVSATDGTKKYVYFDIDITASGLFGKGHVQTSNGNTWSSQTCNEFHADITSAIEVSTILVRTRQGWGFLGVGSTLILDVC